MTVLDDYKHFNGSHWETGCIYNFFDYRGFKAPHTGKPYSEALMLGVSGGITMGYFSFAYKGYDPQARVLTRNTFDPRSTMLSRLGVVQNIYQTANAGKAEANLLRELENGTPVLVWADAYSLPYNCLSPDGMWFMRPILVYGYDPQADRVLVADRAAVPLALTTAELARARARIKKDKFRLATLEAPDPAKLASAIQQGIRDCVKLFTEKPPKGSKNNFGFAAYRWWIELLTRPGARLSWEREFPAGTRMYSGLVWAFTDIATFGWDTAADRGLYADFLDEAGLVLDRPGLADAAQSFRESAAAWARLALALLPDDVPAFVETRQSLLLRRSLFRKQGGEAQQQIRVINARLKEIRDAMETHFPLDAGQVMAFRENLAGHVRVIHDIEQGAIAALEQADT